MALNNINRAIVIKKLTGIFRLHKLKYRFHIIGRDHSLLVDLVLDSILRAIILSDTEKQDPTHRHRGRNCRIGYELF